MNATPKVSVIVPIYKVERYLRQCVDSIRAQTLQALEIILVDDGSPDGCPAICDAYAQEDTRIRVIHKPNGGLLRARITGVQAATAPYVGFVDSDDFVAPEMFATLLSAAMEHQAQLVCASFRMYRDEAHQTPYVWDFPAGFFTGERLLNEFYPAWFENRKTGAPGLIKAVWCKLFDRALLADVYTRVPPQVTIAEDFITTYAAAALAERIVTLPDVMPYYYRMLEGSMFRTYWRNFFANANAVLESLAGMPHRQEAERFIREGVERHRAYTVYDTLYNECKPNKTSAREEVTAIVNTLTGDEAWLEAARLDVLPRDNQTSRLFRRLLLHRRPRLLLAAIRLATLKNRVLERIRREN